MTNRDSPEDAMAWKNDNRMGWIRNLEALPSAAHHYVVEYELGSESHVPGLLDYAEGKIICASKSTAKSRRGLWLYNLVLRYPIGPHYPNRIADRKGYCFKDGIVGELLTLMSLFFRRRFYLISSSLVPENPRAGLTIKIDHPFVRVECNPGIHPPIFESANNNDFAEGFKKFLDVVKTLDHKLHQKFILACHHYARAVKEVGVDPEMVFIRLVSAIEALSKDMDLTHRDDAFEATVIAGLIEQSQLSTEQQGELRNIFDLRKSRKKFVRFIQLYCGGYFKGGNFKARHAKIRKEDLPKLLDAIYSARSKYLHEGEPMYLSTPIKGGEKWDTDPTCGMILDNRSFRASDKLPYAYFFEGLIRHSLLNYLKRNVSQP